MKHKFTIITTLITLLILIAMTGAAISLKHCMEWQTYCNNIALPPNAMRYTQNIIAHAYYWMGASFICVCLILIMTSWYYCHHQKESHTISYNLPPMPTPAQEYQRLQSDVLKNQITVDGNTLQTRHQIAVLLDYLIQNTAHEILYSEFNQLFYDNFYDGSPSSKQKINNLKYETNSLLKGTRFEITKQSADRLALVLKT